MTADPEVVNVIEIEEGNDHAAEIAEDPVPEKENILYADPAESGSVAEREEDPEVVREGDLEAKAEGDDHDLVVQARLKRGK